MYDVTGIGELLIDFTPAGQNEGGIALFARNPGGAPANALAANSRLGGKTAFVGKVGDDGFGHYLRDTLKGIGIDTRGLVLTGEIPTTLAFVQLDDRGDRSFSFYRKPGADIMLTFEEVDRDLLSRSRIVHFGSVSLTDEPSRTATLQAVQAAKVAGAIISYDPNYRPPLWPGVETAVEQMKAGLALADLVKVSEEELALLTGETDLAKGADRLRAFGPTFVLVTLGAKGAYYQLGKASGILPAYDVATIDTNGAGDAFTGAIHRRLQGKALADLQALSPEEVADMVDFANAAGSLVTAKHGAIPAMPTWDEVEDCRTTVPKLGA